MKRVKVKPQCPNPLFVSWLEEWKRDAASRSSEMEFCFGKALKTLKKFPLPLKSGKDCIILENFGPKLCAMLDKKLTECFGELNIECKETDEFVVAQNHLNLVKTNNSGAKVPASNKRAKKFEASEEPAKKKQTVAPKDGLGPGRDNKRRENPKKKLPYIPTLRSGGYAILLTLYERSQDPEFIGFMTKADLQADAQKHCDTSLRKPDPGTRYSAWSSMSTLIEKGLVIKNSNPAKFRLTDAGLAVAMQLSEVDENDCALGVSSECSSSGTSRETSASAKERNRLWPVDNDVLIMEAESCDEEVNEQLGFFTNSVSPVNDCKKLSELLSVKDYERETLRQCNKNIYEENKASDRQRTIENHLQILDINSRTKSQQSATSTNERNINVILKANSFDVILLVDDRETAGGKTRPKDDITIAELTQTNVRFEVRHLKIGDFTWIARCRNSGEELILPYIVERKRMDDFGGSIKDGRYREQKFRLKKSGIQNITYLIEHHGNNQFSGLPLTTLFQAATNTLVQDGFTLKYTKCHRDSMIYLASMSITLTKIYQDKTLVGCKKEDLIPTNTTDDLIQLMVFKDFNKSAAKIKNFKTKDMFIRHLVQLKGLSVEKAVAIVDFYPTPTALKKAYVEAGSSGEHLLASVQFGSTKRQLGPALSKTLHQFYTRKDF